MAKKAGNTKKAAKKGPTSVGKKRGRKALADIEPNVPPPELNPASEDKEELPAPSKNNKEKNPSKKSRGSPEAEEKESGAADPKQSTRRSRRATMQPSDTARAREEAQREEEEVVYVQVLKDKSKTVYRATKDASGGIKFTPKGRKTPISFDSRQHTLMEASPEEALAESNNDSSAKEAKKKAGTKAKPKPDKSKPIRRARPQAYKDVSSTDEETDLSDEEGAARGSPLSSTRGIPKRRDSLGQGDDWRAWGAVDW